MASPRAGSVGRVVCAGDLDRRQHEHVSKEQHREFCIPRHGRPLCGSVAALLKCGATGLSRGNGVCNLRPTVSASIRLELLTWPLGTRQSSVANHGWHVLFVGFATKWLVCERDWREQRRKIRWWCEAERYSGLVISITIRGA